MDVIDEQFINGDRSDFAFRDFGALSYALGLTEGLPAGGCPTGILSFYGYPGVGRGANAVHVYRRSAGTEYALYGYKPA